MDRRRVAMGSDGERVMLASLIVFVNKTLSLFVSISRPTYTIYRPAYKLRSAAPPLASFDFPGVFLLAFFSLVHLHNLRIDALHALVLLVHNYIRRTMEG